MKKIYIIDKYHHKNQFFLDYLVDTFYNRVYDIHDADIIFSASTFVNPEKYPNKKFILGPHFSVFPEKQIKRVNNHYKNCIYIQPSEPFRKIWVEEYGFTNIPVNVMAFGVDTNKFIPDNWERNLVMVYHKNRDPKDLKYVEDFLKSKNINYKMFDYKKRYAEEDYLSSLRHAKYMIWVGAHESQGFALQEALSCNVPLLVWSVQYKVQEWSHRKNYEHVKTQVSSAPYWDNMCGEIFYKDDDLEPMFNIFIKKLDTYSPRKFILENLSFLQCAKKWQKLIKDI